MFPAPLATFFNMRAGVETVKKFTRGADTMTMGNSRAIKMLGNKMSILCATD